MKQLKQEQQFNHAQERIINRNESNGTTIIHNPNSREETAKYLAKLVLQGLEQRECGDKI